MKSLHYPFVIPLELPSSVLKQLPTLSDNWLLDSYFVGPENNGLCYLFDDSVLDKLGHISPVVLYGERHLGKTALGITLAVRWSKAANQRPLCFTTADNFSKEFYEACELGDLENFRKRHRTCRLLLIDGLDSIASQPAAQEELTSTLDALLLLQRPAILTCQALPATLRGLRRNLASRLSAGYSLELARPSRSTRNKLIDAFFQQMFIPFQTTLSSIDLHQLTDTFSSSPLSPDQIHRLVKMAATCRTEDGSFDISRLARLFQQPSNKSPVLPDIVRLVCRRLRVRLTDIRGSTRQANIVRARSLAIYLARKHTDLSLLQIGEYFSGRDHSTVLHSIRKITDSLKTDHELALLCRDIETGLTVS